MSLINSKYVSYFIDFINRGQVRSVNAKKNILASFIIKGSSIIISLALVPLTINYINPSRYGIWLTLSSIVGWFSFFDVGLTQGLRNKFAEARTFGDDAKAQAYVSTTYAILSITFFILWVIFLLVNRFLNWADILNVSGSMSSEISMLAIIVFTYFCIQFVLRIITTILFADQQPAKSSLVDLLGQIVSLILVFILVKITKGSLIKLGLALCVSPIIILLIANIYLFRKDYRKYRPVFSKVDFSCTKDLLNLGVVFFVIQVAAIIQYQTANIIIARNFSTLEVTSYNIVFKYFGVLSMVFAIFLTPLWSASTEAFLKNDIPWIKNAIKKYSLLNIFLIVIGLLMLVFSGLVYRIWLDGKVEIPFTLSLWGFLYFNVIIYGGKYVSFLNGINALRVQFLASLISPVIYIAIALVLIKYFKMGVYAVFVASIIANFNAFLLAPIQYNMIINKGKKGLWIK